MDSEVRKVVDDLVDSTKKVMLKALADKEAFTPVLLLYVNGHTSLVDIGDFMNSVSGKDLLATVVRKKISEGKCDISMICTEAWTLKRHMSFDISKIRSIKEMEDKEEALIMAVQTDSEHLLIMCPIERESGTLGEQTEFDAGFRSEGEGI